MMKEMEMYNPISWQDIYTGSAYRNPALSVSVIGSSYFGTDINNMA